MKIKTSIKLVLRTLFLVTINFYLAFAVTDIGKPKVIAARIQWTEDFQKLIYPGRVSAKINSTITADLDGHVVKVIRNLGAQVGAGEVVLYIENTDPAFTYSAVPVRAPVSGVLSQVNFQMMSKVNKGDKLFTVINPNSLNVEMEVPAAEIALLKVGMTGQFQTTPSAKVNSSVRISGLSPVVDPKSGTALAQLEFIKPHKKDKTSKVNLTFPVGTVGQVVFDVSMGKTLVVPENAITYFEGKPSLYFIDEENRTKRKSIELGEQRDGQFIVSKGLLAGEKIVIRANKNVKDGDELEIQNADELKESSQAGSTAPKIKQDSK